MPTTSDLYQGRLLRSRFQSPDGSPKPKVERLLQRRHRPSPALSDDNIYHTGDHEWHVPLGLAYAWRNPLRRWQMVVLHPWYVTYHDANGRRHKKEFQALPHAVHFVASRAQYTDPHAAVVSKHTYDIIPQLRGKLPRKHKGVTYYWCPLCVTARPFFAVTPERTFYTMKKVQTDSGRYRWTDRRMRVLACRVCGCTNQNHTFRRSNQPWEKRTFKQGVRRARRRR